MKIILFRGPEFIPGIYGSRAIDTGGETGDGMQQEQKNQSAIWQRNGGRREEGRSSEIWRRTPLPALAPFPSSQQPLSTHPIVIIGCTGRGDWTLPAFSSDIAAICTFQCFQNGMYMPRYQGPIRFVNESVIKSLIM